jgi:ComF family protein
MAPATGSEALLRLRMTPQRRRIPFPDWLIPDWLNSTRVRKGIASPGPFWNNLRYLVRAQCDLLIPARCLLCDSHLPLEHSPGLLCAECQNDLASKTGTSCRRCGSELDAEATTDDCPKCRKTKLWFDSVITLGSYHDQLQSVVLRMKHPGHQSLSSAMGRFLGKLRHQDLLDLDADWIVPIPMYWTRWFFRGMNSPEVISACLGRILGIPVQKRLLARRRNTLPQKGLRPQERFQNMRGAFQIRHREAVKNARVLLVDDVLTTGATCSEAAKMFKQAGAAMVAVAVIARA